MNPELTLQNLFVEFTPVKIKKTENWKQKVRGKDKGHILNIKYSRKGAYDRSWEIKKIRRLGKDRGHILNIKY